MLKDRAAEHRQFYWRLVFAAAALGTAWLSLVPVTVLPDVSVWDKLSHALTYATLMLLLLPSMAVPRTSVAGSWLMLYGVIIEFAQAASGFRTGDWRDALANLCGILVAGLLWRAFSALRNKTPRADTKN